MIKDLVIEQLNQERSYPDYLFNADSMIVAPMGIGEILRGCITIEELTSK